MTNDGVRRWSIGNVRLFDGDRVHDDAVVTIEGDRVSAVETGGAAGRRADVDGHRGLLIPGLVDAHVHVTSPEDIRQLAAHGVTTALDMGTHSVAGLRDAVGTVDLRTAGPPASAPGGIHTRFMGFPPDSAVIGPDDAERFVAARAEEGSDYLKIIVEPPQAPAALSADSVAALARAARAHGSTSVAHAAAHLAFVLAVAARVDIVRHIPLERPLDEETAARMNDAGTVAIPTLTMMRAVAMLPQDAPAYRPGRSPAHAVESVRALHAAGVRILAGTDAKTAPDTILNVAPGRTLHDELALLVDAGLTPLEALTSATSHTADVFGLADRGRATASGRADLVLSGDPLTTIADSRTVVRVWIGGAPVGAAVHDKDDRASWWPTRGRPRAAPRGVCLMNGGPGSSPASTPGQPRTAQRSTARPPRPAGTGRRSPRRRRSSL